MCTQSRCRAQFVHVGVSKVPFIALTSVRKAARGGNYDEASMIQCKTLCESTSMGKVAKEEREMYSYIIKCVHQIPPHPIAHWERKSQCVQ